MGKKFIYPKDTIPLLLLKFLVNNSFKTITNSSGTLKVSLENGLEKDKLEIIPFGVDTNIFKT